MTDEMNLGEIRMDRKHISGKRMKMIKRILSIMLVIAMVLDIIPVSELGSVGDFMIVPVKVYAENDPVFEHDGDNNIVVDISKFVAYSEAYANYPEYHQYDNITIEAENSSNYYLNGFRGLGTSDFPFAGSITLGTNFNAAFNLATPLFNYVYDTVTVNGGNALAISRSYLSDAVSVTTPLIATVIKPDSDEEKKKATWNIMVVPNKLESESIVLEDFGGLLGTLEEGANLTLVTSLYKDNDETNDGTIEIKGEDGIGFICKTMKAGASLSVTIEGDRTIKAVTTTNGNAGGLVGTVESGASFTYIQTTSDSFIGSANDIKTENGDYAGGLAGYNNGGMITITMPEATQYVIDQKIQAKEAAGGLFGYYRLPANTTINTGLYDIDCQLSADKNCGGIAGVLETGYDITVNRVTTLADDDIRMVVSAGSSSNIGGLFGKYTADSSLLTLQINGVSTDITKSSGSGTYGGAIGLAESACYIKFSDFVLTNATNCGALTFGGLVGKGEKSFIDVGNVTIAVTDTYKGGALVGNIGDGVLRMRGAIDLSSTESAVPGSDDEYYKVGQIVGYRDDALVFSESEYSLQRGSAVEVDDIGTWGEYLRFGEHLTEADVLIINETTHQIEIGKPGTVIKTAEDFAKTSLCFQIDADDAQGNPFVSFSTSGEGTDYTYATINAADVTISLDSTLDESGLDLAGTGLLGLTRDNDTNASGNLNAEKCVFSGTFEGNGKKLILAIGDESDGFNKKIYRHKLNGLFGILNGGTIQNVELAGSINIKDQRKYMYVGAAASRSNGIFHVTNLTVNTQFSLADSGDGDNGRDNYYFNVGRLLGQASSGSGDITIENSTFNGDVNAKCTDSYFRLGGVIGVIDQKSSFTAEFNNVTTSGLLQNISEKADQRIGGLVAEIDDATNNTVERKIMLTGVKADGLTVDGAISNGGKLGGMLGFQWRRIEAVINGVVVGDTKQSVVKMTGESGKTAGLVYQATGYWNVENLTFADIKIEANNKGKSLGMLVNSGVDGNNRLYIDLRSGYQYSITTVDFNDKQYEVFDELVAYSAAEGKVMENGQGIVSIHVAGSTGGGLTMDGTNASNSYVPKTTLGATPNPNTRYYYNLDSVTGTTADAAAFSGDGADVNKLMSWAVNCYAADNLKKYFYADFTEEFSNDQMGVANTTYDLQGYSWYPINRTTSLTVNGNYILYNEGFEGSEAQKSGYSRTSHYDTINNKYTQHRMMQNGLFNNVTNTSLTVGEMKLGGTIGVAKSGEGSGALVAGTLTGDSDHTAGFSVETSLILNGIKVYNLGELTYAPLLINKVSTNCDLNVHHLWANGSAYSGGTRAATSLIGNVGGTNASLLKVDFSDVRLDGRLETDPSDLTVYGTTTSLFTRATFMESFAYKSNSGSYGQYRFQYSEDWEENVHIGHVTYGWELNDGSANNSESGRSEYYGVEFWYDSQSHDNTGSYINYASSVNPADPPANFSAFLPYVKHLYGNGYHQISVNHSSASFGGCGTYNHPYSINSANDLNVIADIISGVTNGLDSNYRLRIDTVEQNRWCNSKNECVEYYWNNGEFTPSTSGSNLTLQAVQEYLANAYYSIDTDNIVLGEGFKGLGTNSSNDFAFRGVIVGNGNTIEICSENPLVFASNGCVVKNLNIRVNKAITLDQGVIGNNNENTVFKAQGGCKAYGAVIGRILGGDNIIDNVTVSWGENASINVKGGGAVIVPVGGYVGVIVNGALIFRGMETKRGNAVISGLSALGASKITYNDAKLSTDYDVTETINGESVTHTYNVLSSDNTKWLYINPIIGRVINGYAITETEAYRPFEDGRRTYPDGSLDYCVTTGSGTSVINGETYSSGSYTISPVTMRNGTKNYSIADISTKIDSFTVTPDSNVVTFENATIMVPNAQALFIISLLTESGICTSNNGNYSETNSILKPYTDYMSTHLASYEYVGDNALTDATAPSSANSGENSAKNDYVKASEDNSTTEDGNAAKVPYIVKNYTPKVSGRYPAFNLTAFKSTGNSSGREIYLNMVFSGDDTGSGKQFNMPDGFRGLGAVLLQNKQSSSGSWYINNCINHGMFLNSFNGNKTTVSINMKLYLYQNSYENYRTPTDNQAYMKTGFGFFNVLRSNYTSNNDNRIIKDLTIKGSVKFDNFQAKGEDWGKHIDYANNGENGINSADKPAVGGFVGSPGSDTGSDKGGGSIYLDNIRVENLYVYGPRYAGGIYGCTNSESKYYFMGCSADNLEVHGSTAGGMIGYIRNISTEIKADFQDKEYNLIGVICHAKWEGDNGENGYASAGGLFGDDHASAYKGKANSEDDAIIVQGVTIGCASGKDSGKGYVGYDAEVNNTTVPFSGGVLGTVSRKSYIRLENVKVKDIDILGKNAGGMIGYTDGRATFEQCEVSTQNGCKIESKYDHDTGASSGFVGRTDINSDNVNFKSINLNNCLLSQYTIAGYRNQAGVIGRTQGGGLYKININNTELREIKIKSNNRSGGIIGYYQDGTINGYNVLLNGLSMDKYTAANPSNYGCLVGDFSSSAGRYVKIAGFSRQGTITREQLVGNKADNAANYFGVGGYVAFADYSGRSLSESTRGVEFSNVKAAGAENNVALSEARNYCPFVTTSPVLNIDTSGDPNFLTGDGTDASIYAKIVSDLNGTSTKRYTIAKNAIKSDMTSGTDAQKNAYYNSEITLITNEMSNSVTEFGSGFGIPRFPLLVVEDTSPANTTNMINSYLRLLTNTEFTFADKTIDYTNQYGYGFDYDIDLIQMRYDQNSGKFVAGSDNSACLVWGGSGTNARFRMYANNVDSGENPQFSLIDLKFYDPANVPIYDANHNLQTAGKVAYHVYVPVFVKKMKRFNFTAKIDAGTEYFASHYTTAMKNGYLFENLGNPVTIEMEYDYDRTAAEWAEAINSGDSVLVNYYKRIAFKSHVTPNTFPVNTTFVLVDAANKDKFYYLNNPSAAIQFGQDGIGFLDFWDFTDENGSHYEPADFYDLLENVRVVQDNEGTLTTVDATYENAAVKSTSGEDVIYYRVIGSEETIDDENRYKVASIGKVNKERYYLSIFTQKQDIDRIFRYEIYSVDANSQTVAGKWSISAEKWTPNKIKEAGTVQYFTGNLYTNTLNQISTDTADHSGLMGEGGNYIINVQMDATVQLTESAVNAGVQRNLATATNAHIYQAFLLTMNMKETAESDAKIGIISKPTKSGKIKSEYYYSAGTTFDEEEKHLVAAPTVVDTSNSFIELRSGQNLRNLLAESGAVTLRANYDLLYSSDQILPQFPKGIFDGTDNLTNGTKVIGYSNVGAGLDSVSYSTNTDREVDSKTYYSANTSAATLVYNTDEEPYSDYDASTTASAYQTQTGPYSMLGINPIEDESGDMYISTYAIYNTELLITDAQYVQMRITLRKRADNYADNSLLQIDDYISDLKVFGKEVDEYNKALPIFSQAEDATNMTTVYTVTVDKSLLQSKMNTNEYIIPITFKVKTGSIFENAGLEYSNYMVNLEVDMREETTSVSPVLYSDTEDHIIYTNAKVRSEVIADPE